MTASQFVPARPKPTPLTPGRHPHAQLTPAQLTPAQLTPAQAFDALYGFCAPVLVRQAYLLTGRRALARQSVERAFELAWRRWPEVARDRDPGGWVRAATHEYALSPWHRFRRRHRQPEPPPGDPSGRALLDVLLRLPPPYRRTLLLHDGVGLTVRQIAGETEATTSAAANRLRHAREALSARLPGATAPSDLHRRLTELAATEIPAAAPPPTVRTTGERRDRQWVRTAAVLVTTLTGTTAITLQYAPDHYERPVPRGAAIHGLPAHVAQGPLSERSRALHEALRSHLPQGPHRLVPSAR
ncbi:DNA-directed RNA polymerase specialized sigma24 family protein [Streptomyces sp. B3I7]|uniref:RNA polymerase sigma factor n=1 Tax=Streptomyces sp. B3I7 TaxID=3042269 RepID=UPI00277D390B|nr:sigma factor-like helix-turn-helix DNA-binding protein [Streptomyces sp. B3I7]MDQ0811681.1 DNA-directed RNA polymerase specialized sigma24 family protein [Streptomyces sp. B3I7]